MSRRPYALFINPSWLGHIPPYMGLIWLFFFQRGWRIHNLVDNPEEAARFCAAQFGDEAALVSHSGFPPPPGHSNGMGEIQLKERQWAALGQAVEQIRRKQGEPKLVFHAWADLWTNIFLHSRCVRRALPLPWMGICLHPVELRVRKSLKRRLWEMIPNLCRHGLPTESRLRALRVPQLKELLLLDENVLGAARRFFPASKISSFPDPADTAIDDSFQCPALERLRAEGRPIIAVVGVLQRRKGFLRLMEAARAAPGNWGFLSAGQTAWDNLSERDKEALRHFMDDPPPNTALHLEFLKRESQLNTLISRSDLLYLAYEDFFHSSNIQVKAASYRKLSLAGPMHLISERTVEYDLGWTLKDFSPATLIEFLARTDRTALEEKARAARFSDFTWLHSIARMNEVLAEVVDSASIPRQ